jgi:hypothetical protein
MTTDEAAFAALYRSDAEQICWRRNKISQLGSEHYFKREYPIVPDEASMASQFDSFITALVVESRGEKAASEGSPNVTACRTAS